MKIVVTGSTGQVGRELCQVLPALGEVVAWDRTQADLESPAAVVARLAHERPAVIINAAAYTAVDKAEQEPERAMLINATAVAAIAAEAHRQNAILVHYSTDYVFDGEAHGRYRETDSTGPLSVYGTSKLAGEQAIAQSGCRAYVFRTSWVYATHGSNFLRTMLRLAAERDELAVVADQHGAPTSAGLIARITADVLSRCAPTPPIPFGLYHLVPSGETTWHGYASFLLDAARTAGMPVRVDPGRIKPLTTAEYPTAARRPANSRLCTEKLEAALARKLPRWEDAVHAAVSELAGR
jgi:dTDP-4-dehydrorhamnose reductase